MKYIFGKGEVAYLVNKNSINVYQLKDTQDIGSEISSNNITNRIDLVFTSITSLDKMITELQNMKNDMIKRKVRKLMKEL